MSLTLRGKKLGVLLRSARLHLGKSVEFCAQAIGVPAEQYLAFELGEQCPSLPEIEVLAFALGLPLDYFWGAISLSEDQDGKNKFNVNQLLALRQRMVGVFLRKTRSEAQLSLDALAEKSGVSAEKIAAYESGVLPIPLPELEALAMGLNTSIRKFQDKSSQVGKWLSQQRHITGFADLSPELQAFVAKPINQPYLELAVRLSEMSVERLRGVAEGLLEITL
jgi:transcriptional regulator with XRE-family HTH domain